MLTSDMKQRRLGICQQFLLRFECEGDGFLNNIVTGDEGWVHHFDPENESINGYKGSPTKKKLKTMPSAGKFTLIVGYSRYGAFRIHA